MWARGYYIVFFPSTRPMADVTLDPIFYEDYLPEQHDVEDYIPPLDPGAANYRRIRIEQEFRERAKERARAAAQRTGYDPSTRKFGSRPTNTVSQRTDLENPGPEIVTMNPIPLSEATYSVGGYSVVEPIENVPEVVLTGASNALTVTPRAKAVKNAESTPVAKTVKILKKRIAAGQSVVAGADRVRSIQHDSFCSEMKREAIRKIAKYLSQLPPKQQVIYEGRLSRLTNWRMTAKEGKAGTPKEMEAVNLKALMRFCFFLEKKALWYASVDLRKAARHTKKCAKLFAGKKRPAKK
jgi:hypothetical protein